MADLGVDIYAFSWYKVYGPHIAMLYASVKAQALMRSLGHYFNPSETVEDKLGLAGGSYDSVQSVKAVQEYLEQEGWWEAMVQHGLRIQEMLLKPSP